MKIVTAKITKILKTKEFEGNYGKMYAIHILLDNGDTGEIIKKSSDAISVGQEITYTIEQTQFGNKIKEVKQQENTIKTNSNSNRNYKADFISFAMSYAKDIVIADKADLSQLTEVAEIIYTRMNNKYDQLNS